MQLRTAPLDLALQRPFTISRGTLYQARHLLVEIEADHLMGLGEAGPDSSGYYGETRSTMQAALEVFAEVLAAQTDPLLLEDIAAALDQGLHRNMAARSAVDMALYDLAGKLLGVPVYRLFGLNPERTPVSSFTIAIAPPEEMARQAAAATDYPILKIKLGTPHDVEIVRAIRSVTSATLRVDANAAWTPREAIRTIEALSPFDIELIEQPVAADDFEGLKLVHQHSPVPIVADESCVTLDDVPRVAGSVDGINIKLAKCGGLLSALKMIHAARAHHLQVMLGCMVSSSLAVTAAAHLTPLVDFADLDGPLLLERDPFAGVRFEKGRILLPDAPGLGVTKSPDVKSNEDR